MAMKVVSVAPRSRRFSSCSLPRLRSQPIQRDSLALQTRRRCSSRKRGRRPAPGRKRRFSRATPSTAVASSASSPSTCLGRRRPASRRAARNAGRLRDWRGGGFRGARSAPRSPPCVVSSVGTATSVRKCEGTPLAQLQCRQQMGVEAETDRAIDQRDRRVDGGDRAQQRQNAERQRRRARSRRARQARRREGSAATAPIAPT